MARGKRSVMAIVLVIFTFLGVITAQSNWIFYGTKLVAKRSGPKTGRDVEVFTETPLTDLFTEGNARKLREIKDYIKVSKDPVEFLGHEIL